MHNKILSIISACFACWISDRTSPSWGHPNLLCPWKYLLHFFLLGPHPNSRCLLAFVLKASVLGPHPNLRCSLAFVLKASVLGPLCSCVVFLLYVCWFILCCCFFNDLVAVVTAVLLEFFKYLFFFCFSRYNLFKISIVRYNLIG